MMNGKILKISSNDLYGNNVDDRMVSLFACFNHKKYMNKYVIFSFLEEYDKKKIYYGSVHIKDDTLVIFNVSDDVVQFIDEFVLEYLNGNIDNKEYEIIDISKMEKVQLVSYGEKGCDKLLELDRISIKKLEDEKQDMNVSKKPVGLYLMLLILIILAVGVTYLYFNPEAFTKEYKMLTCEIKQFNNSMNMNYMSVKEIQFDDNDSIKKVMVTDKYIFNNEDEFNTFKDEEKQYEYFKSDGTFKYNIEDLSLSITYLEENLILSYGEVRNYLKKQGYDCIEGKYYE